MRLQVRVYLVEAFLVFLCVGIIILGCATPQISVSYIPIQCAVNHEKEPDNSSNTEISILIEKDFKGNLPDDIESITVNGPEGKLPINKEDFIYYPQYRAFWISMPGAPSTGTYTFTVASGSISASATDNQAVLTKIPTPITSTFTTSEGKTLTCRSPTFSWSAVAAAPPLYYRLEINDMQNNRVYATSYVEDMLSIRLPLDLLKVGQNYRWRVRAVDGANWIEMNNRSNSEWREFSVGQTISECKYRYQVPRKTTDGWETSSLAEESIDPATINELMSNILGGSFRNIHSVLLIKNGKLVLEEYFSGYDRGLKHTIQSDTKSITSILVGIAIERGMISNINQKVYEFFPEYKDLNWNDQKSEITLKNVLTMTAGLNWAEMGYADSDSRYSLSAMCQSDDSINYVLERKTVAAPGEKFLYSSGLTHVLGGIIRNTTGLSVDKFAEKYLFSPLGISDYRWEKLPDGTFNMGWGLHLKPRDMAKIGYLFLKGGNWKGKQIISKKWVDESTKAHVTGDIVFGSGYGYQWWRGNTVINGQIINAFYAAGHGGQYVFVFPALDLVAVFTSKAHGNPAGEFRPLGILANYIIPAVLSAAPAKKTIKLNSKVADKYVGGYKNKILKVKLKIFRKNDKLYAEGFLFGDRMELLPVAKNQFIGISNDVGKLRLTFSEDENGRMKGLNLDIGFSRLGYETTKWF